MKKYKLIKQYPGSDSLGTEITGSKETMYSKGFGYRNYDWAHVETHPEYWEEVVEVEKDYEILRYYSIENPSIGRTTCNSKLNDTYNIYSVKRLSDGEVFTVGDKFTGYSSEGNTIQRFELLDNILIIHTTNKGSISNTPGTGLFKSIQKEVEKDYEILSYLKKGSTTCTTTKRRGGIYHEQYWNIHSVKRLSDGEVFTVGDRVKVYEQGSIKTITEIAINSSRALVKEGIWLRYDSGSSHLTHAIKAKQPIFITHDGKDIFEGDTVWYVNKESLNLDHFKTHANIAFRSDINAYFLTKEAAENYIEKNKVLFTTEDGVGIKRGDTFYFVDTDLSISLSNASTGCGQYSERKYFSTYEAAQYYVVVNAKVLSIEDFYNAISSQYGNGNKLLYLQRLVKQRLNLK